MTEVLDTPTLNRTLLARQHLLARTTLPALDMVERLVGMQAQNPLDPYVGLWSRLEGFDPRELADAIEQRQAVRMTLFRATVHLVSARDCLAIRPVIASVVDRVLQSGFRRQLEGIDLAALGAVAAALVEAEPRTAAQLRPLLAERFPGRDEDALVLALAGALALVQLPPRGVWGKTARPVLTTAQAWLGRELAADDRPDELVLRYLRAFGPATPADVRTWSGLAGAKDILARLELRTFRNEAGQTLFDVPDGVIADPATPAPPRFLPVYDNVFLSHADRTRITDAEHMKNWGVGLTRRGPILVDGFVAGLWRQERKTGALEIELSAARSDEIDAEAQRLAELLDADSIGYQPLIRT